ncbi:MAG: DNA pilot protein [Microviridae sp.]|nr:MAG: DNA pilot protein [Microviridae sp.]
MPLPLLPIIMAGASLAGTGINAASQGAMNRKTRKWNEQRYGIERQDALADWHMQNAYNSPQSQMARLKEAGLNPNLVYGNGATATSSQGVKNPDTKGWNPDAVQFDPGSAMGAYIDAQVKHANTDNLRVQKTVMEAEQRLKDAQTLATLMNAVNTQQTTAKSKFELQLSQDLRETTIEAAKKNVEKLTADINQTTASTQYTLAENERKAALQAPTLALAVENVLNAKLQGAKTSQETMMIKQAMQIAEQDEIIKTAQAELWRKGINPNDPTWLRYIAEIVGKLVEKAAGGKKPWWMPGK